MADRCAGFKTTIRIGVHGISCPCGGLPSVRSAKALNAVVFPFLACLPCARTTNSAFVSPVFSSICSSHSRDASLIFVFFGRPPGLPDSPDRNDWRFANLLGFVPRRLFTVLSKSPLRSGQLAD